MGAELNDPFLDFLRDGLERHSKEETSKNLGDRTTYIGGSDLGLCPRKAILSKIDVQPLALRKHIIFERGHLAETLIENALKAKRIQFSSQVKVESKEKVYLKAHLDFLIHKRDEDIMLEIKTVSSMPQAPRESWLLQVQYGLGLLRERGSNCQRGYIVCIDLNSGECKTFSFSFEQSYYSLAVKKAEKLYAFLTSALEKGEFENIECETSPLCSFCSYSDSCKSFGNGAVKMSGEIEEELERYKKQTELFKQIKTEKGKMEKTLIAFMQSADLQKLKSGDSTILLRTRAGKTTFDTKTFQNDYPDLFQLYSNQASDSQYLSVV